MLALFGLARALGFERLESSLVALVWAVSPAVVSISALTRQYDLVALTRSCSSGAWCAPRRRAEGGATANVARACARGSTSSG